MNPSGILTRSGLFKALTLGYFALLNLGGSVALASSLETWKTSFSCGGQTFAVISHCRASGKPFELNQCAPDQSLTGATGQVRLPATTSIGGVNPLFAITWGCATVNDRPYITLSYASGMGRSEDDELSEVFSLELQPISDKALQVQVYRNEGKGTHGRIRSVLPDGGEGK